MTKQISIELHGPRFGLGVDNEVVVQNMETGAQYAVTPPNPTADVDYTVEELNRLADVSSRLVAAGATLTLTELLHDGKTILLDTAAGSVVTLPAATGSGARFRFQVKTLATSNAHIIKVANATDIMQGLIFTLSDSGNAALGWAAGGTADTITLNRSTTGSVSKGEFIEIEDVAAGVFLVHGFTQSTGTEATPFSATVS